MPVQFALLTLVPLYPYPTARMFFRRNSCSDERRLLRETLRDTLVPLFSAFRGDVCNLEAASSSYTEAADPLLMACTRKKEGERRAIPLYRDGDLLVSGPVVLTSATSVPAPTFIHFSHFAPRIFGAFGLSSSAYRRAYRASVLSGEDFSPRYASAIGSPATSRARTFRSIFSGSFLRSFVLSQFSIRCTRETESSCSKLPRPVAVR